MPPAGANILSNNRRSKLHAVIDCLFFSFGFKKLLLIRFFTRMRCFFSVKFGSGLHIWVDNTDRVDGHKSWIMLLPLQLKKLTHVQIESCLLD